MQEPPYRDPSADIYASQMRNYFTRSNESYQGFKERIDGLDVIDQVCDELRGVKKDSFGRLQSVPEWCMLNEMGVSRTRMVLKTSVNKITHLTKYENNSRVLTQVRTQIQAYIQELVCSLRKWAPDGKPKVPNWPLVVHLVENALLASMLRGEEGFEAKNLTQQHAIMEHVESGNPQSPSFFARMFGRG